MLDVAGVEAPNDMQGESLVPLLKGNTEDFREAVYYHYYEYPSIHMVKRHYAIVTEKYKLIHFYYDRLRVKEIVERMGFSNEQVAKNTKSKCMKKLRELVEKEPLYLKAFKIS